jgi:hypothetical protein
MKLVKSQITSTKLQMIRQAHHPELSRRVNLKFQYSNSKQNTRNQIDSTVYDMLHSALAKTVGNSSWQVKTCLDHWCLEFGYYLLFVIWCLEFFIL